jgi:hypothetical protein
MKSVPVLGCVYTGRAHSNFRPPSAVGLYRATKLPPDEGDVVRAGSGLRSAPAAAYRGRTRSRPRPRQAGRNSGCPPRRPRCRRSGRGRTGRCGPPSPPAQAGRGAGGRPAAGRWSRPGPEPVEQGMSDLREGVGGHFRRHPQCDGRSRSPSRNPKESGAARPPLRSPPRKSERGSPSGGRRRGGGATAGGSFARHSAALSARPVASYSRTSRSAASPSRGRPASGMAASRAFIPSYPAEQKRFGLGVPPLPEQRPAEHRPGRWPCSTLGCSASRMARHSRTTGSASACRPARSRLIPSGASTPAFAAGARRAPRPPSPSRPGARAVPHRVVQLGAGGVRLRVPARPLEPSAPPARAPPGGRGRPGRRRRPPGRSRSGC